MEQMLIVLCIVGAMMLLGLLVDYKTLYCIWLFTLPVFRNVLNVKTPVSDLKLPYLLFLSVFLSWLISLSKGNATCILKRTALRRMNIALLALLATTVAASLASPSPLSGLRVIIRTCYIIAIFVVTTHSLSTPAQTLKILRIWSLSLIIVILLGFAFYVLRVLPPGYVLSMESGYLHVTQVGQDLIGEYDIGSDGSMVNRYSVGFGNLFDTSADFAILGMFLSLGWAAYEQRSGSRNWAWFWSAICGLALVLTYTRGAWLSAVVGLLIFAYGRRSQLRSMIAICTILGVVVLADAGSLSERATSIDPSLLSRAARLNTAVDIIWKNPLLGAGPGVFTQELTDATQNWQWLDPEAEVSAHSAIIQHLGEQGAIGLAALACLFACYFKPGWRLLKRLRESGGGRDIMGCAVFAAFVALTLHSFALPAFEDSFWVTLDIGYVLAIQCLHPMLSTKCMLPVIGGISSPNG